MKTYPELLLIPTNTKLSEHVRGFLDHPWFLSPFYPPSLLELREIFCVNKNLAVIVKLYKTTLTLASQYKLAFMGLSC